MEGNVIINAAWIGYRYKLCESISTLAYQNRPFPRKKPSIISLSPFWIELLNKNEIYLR